MVNTKIETTEVARLPATQIAVRANNYSYAELADIYNKTRVDYIVPMPMNAKRMEEYVTRYDVQLDASFVSLTHISQPIGIAMLGIRSGRAWVTRLGVVPEGRRLRTGRLLVDHLLAEARARGAWIGQLEVIVGNTPALRLFESYGFAVTRELLVVRRPPGQTPANPAYDALTVIPLAQDEIATMLKRHNADDSWVSEPRSILQSGNLRGFWLRNGDDLLGWTVYHYSPFQLEHIVIGGLAQQNPDAAGALLYHIQKQHPKHDTKIENIPALSPLWPVFQRAGYIETFRRLEMIAKF